MNLAIKLITLANSGGILFGIYSLIEGITKPNPYNFPVPEFIVGPSLILICTIWITLSLWIDRDDSKQQRLTEVKQ